MAEKSSHDVPPKTAKGRVLNNILLVSSVSIAVTFALFVVSRNHEIRKFDSRFEADASIRAFMVEEKLSGGLAAARILYGYLAEEDEIDGIGKKKLTRAMEELLAGRPEVAGLAWVLRTSGRGDWLPALHAGARSGETAAGFGSDAWPMREAAIVRARDTGKPAATQRLSVRGTEGVVGMILVFIPIYAKGMPAGSEAERRLAIRGFAAAVLSVEGLLSAGDKNMERLGLPASLSDAADTPALQPPRSSSAGERGYSPLLSPLYPEPPLYSHPIDFAGRELRVEVSASQAYMARNYPISYWLFIPIDFALTFFLGLYLNTVLSGRARMERKIFDRTADLLRIEDDLRATNAAMRDEVAEHRRAKEEILDLYNNAPCGYHSLDADGVYVRVNETELLWLGYSRRQVIGRRKFQDFLTPESLKVFEEQFPAYKIRGFVRNLEFDMIRKDGTILPVLLNSTVIKNSRGEFIMSRSTIYDISARKAMEEELRAAKDAAEASARAKSAFLANMSHEIRTPMNAIVGLARLAMDTPLTPKQRDYLSKIKTSSEALMGLINDILDVSRIEAGRMEIEQVGFKIDKLLEDVQAVVGVKAEEKGIALTMRIAPGVPRSLLGDPLRLGQVLINLIGNAVKFTEKGSVEVSVTPVHRRMDRVGVLFSVRDTGIGIPAEQQARLFKPFTQADESMTRKYGGTGLGLAISGNLVSLMGGRIDVSSEPGAGSEFSFILELVELPDAEGEPEPPAPAAAPVPRQAKGRILVAEDNEINQQVIREILEGMGLAVEIAKNGREAVDRVSTGGAVDAVLMDLQMPEMDGYEAARAIKARPDLQRIPIIAVTAHALSSERQRCMEAGMDGYVSKPVNPDRLIAALRNWIPALEEQASASAKKELSSVEPEARTAASLPGLDMKALLERLNGNRTLMLRLLGDFARKHGEAAARIRESLAAGGREEARRIAHSLKGVSGNMCAMGVFEASKNLEDALHAQSGGGAEELIDRLDEAMRPLIQSILLLSPQEPPSQGGRRRADKPENLAVALDKLDALLERNSFSARVALGLLKDRLRQEGLKAHVDRMEACLARLDYAGAGVSLAAIKSAIEDGRKNG